MTKIKAYIPAENRKDMWLALLTNRLNKKGVHQQQRLQAANKQYQTSPKKDEKIDCLIS